MGLTYQKRRLKANKVRRQIRAIRVMLSRLRLLTAFFMIIAICYFGIWVLKRPQWYINSDKLAKADPCVLKIQGNVITPDYKIINMIRQTQLPHIQIFRLNTKELEENISQLQPVKKVYVRRYWFPARFVVNIEERTPAFLLAPNLESELNPALTSDGIIIDHEYLPFNKSIKVKKLLTYGVRDGKEEVWDKKKVEEIIKLVKAIEIYSNQEVQYIDLRNQKDVYIMLKEHLIRFGEINDTALARAKWIATILPEAKKIDQKIKYIDLRWEDARYFRLEGSVDAKDENKDENKPEENSQSPQKPASQHQKPASAQTHNPKPQTQQEAPKPASQTQIIEIKEENKPEAPKPPAVPDDI